MNQGSRPHGHCMQMWLQTDFSLIIRSLQFHKPQVIKLKRWSHLQEPFISHHLKSWSLLFNEPNYYYSYVFKGLLIFFAQIFPFFFCCHWLWSVKCYVMQVNVLLTCKLYPGWSKNWSFDYCPINLCLCWLCKPSWSESSMTVRTTFYILGQ